MKRSKVKAQEEIMDENIRAGMEELFREAEEKGLWLHTSYQGIWFSPEELRKAQSEGRFCWGPVNWTLRKPEDYIGEHEARFNEAANALRGAQSRVRQWRVAREKTEG